MFSVLESSFMITFNIFRSHHIELGPKLGCPQFGLAPKICAYTSEKLRDFSYEQLEKRILVSDASIN